MKNCDSATISEEMLKTGNSDPLSLDNFAVHILTIGRNARSRVNETDVRIAKLLKLSTGIAHWSGRVGLLFSHSPFGWISSTLLLGYYFSVEAQLNHTVMHKAFDSLPNAKKLHSRHYESLALPFQSQTWGDAHRIHHANPSLIEVDPDTIHCLFRVHQETPWRPWHLFNTFIGSLLVFEIWAFEYDHFLKAKGLRDLKDRGEIKKFSLFVLYQHVFFTLLAGLHWASLGQASWAYMLSGSLSACLLRNLVFTGLQTASSVGTKVSTRHHRSYERKKPGLWFKFQVETSKNFRISGLWKIVCGGLDRHIEHHLYPHLPPTRLHEVSQEIQPLCERAGVAYDVYESVWSSLADSFFHLARLSWPPKKK